MEFIERLSETIRNSLYNNQHSIAMDTIIFSQNLIIRDEYGESDFINSPVSYQKIGNYIIYYMNKEKCRFIEFILDDEDEENNTVVLNIVCEK